MTSRILCGSLLGLLLVMVLGFFGQSEARELRETRVNLPTYGGQSWGEGTILRRERHVLERRPAGDGSFRMNGRWYQAVVGRCHRWVAGDRIRLRAGSWAGGPVLIRNLRRGGTCGFAGAYG